MKELCTLIEMGFEASLIPFSSLPGVAVLRGHVYAVGGFDGSRQLTSVERYDPSKDSWEEVAPLLRARSGVGVAVIDDNLFALGKYLVS